MDFAQVDWEFILATIREERCVLLLGPEMATLPDGRSFHDGFVESLDLSKNDLVASYYDQVDLFLFEDAIAKTRVYYKLKAFYKDQALQDQSYKHLAQIPFHLVLSTTPDRFLPAVMDQHQFPYEFSFFNKVKVSNHIPEPHRSQPLIYNLTGSLEEEESLILTHDDLFEYLTAILAQHNLPNELKNQLQTAHSFIFLGFGFSKWYVQLILRLLNLHNDRYKFVRYAANQKLNASVVNICKDQFKIEFIPEDIPQFVEMLYEKCKQADMLRSTDSSTETVSSTILRLIESDDIAQALQHMKDFFDDKDEDLYNEVIGLTGRSNRLQRKIRQQVLDEKEAGQETAKIRVAILELVNEVKELE